MDALNNLVEFIYSISEIDITKINVTIIKKLIQLLN